MVQAVYWLLPGDRLGAARVGLVSIFNAANGAGQAVAWPALARVRVCHGVWPAIWPARSRVSRRVARTPRRTGGAST